MRRFWGTLLLLLMLAGMAQAADPVEITLWHQLNYAERQALADQLAQFKKMYPWIEVTSIYRETEQLRAGFQNSALGGSGPELIHGPSDQIGPFGTMEIILPLEDIFTQEEQDRLDPQALVWYQGHLYQIADRLGNHLCLIYNKEFVPIPPETSGEMIRIGQENTVDIDGDGKIDRFGLVWNFTEPYYFAPFLSGFGGWMLDENAVPTLNTQANINALRFVQDLRDKYKITAANSDYELAHNLFLEGKAAMTINGDWSFGAYEESNIDFGVTRIPKIDQTGLWPGPIVSPRGFSVNVNIDPEKLEPTISLLRFLLSDDAQRTMAAQTGIIPSSKDLRDDPVVTESPVMRGSLYQLEVAKPMPIVPELRAIWDSMRPHYQSLLGGAIGPEEAARRMQEDSVRKIKEMNEITPPSPYVPVLYAVFAGLLIYGFWKTRRSFVDLGRDMRKRPFVYSMLLPAFIVIAAVVFYPFLYNIVLSLSNMGLRNFRNWEVVGFQNYGKVFLEPSFYTVLLKTIIWTVVNVFFHVTLGVMLALLLNRALPGRGAIRMLLILPWAVPQYITALTWRGMFNQEYGAINLIISNYLHMPIVNWLGSPTEAFIACILTNIWLGFPFMMIVALGGLQSIPTQLYEAADIDGASSWAKLKNITIPMLKPVMAPAIVLGMVWTFNNLNVIWLVSNAGEPADKTHILVSFVYKSAFNLYRYGYAAAMSMVIFLILLTFSLIYMRRTKATEAVY